MRFATGFRTDVGRGRPENEDNFLVDPEHGLYAVADGMGGHRAGEVASAVALETLKEAYLGGRRLDEAVAAANAAVFAKGADDASMRGMGTTLTAIALQGGSTAVLGHVGDSRAYLMRQGAVTQVTDDHSLVEQLVREGRLTPEEAQNHPQRAIITRALGVDSEVQVDTYRVDLQPGDRLLICSDGLTNMLSDNTIGQTLRRHADPQQAADTLVDMANQAGGDDNITVVVLDALNDGSGTAAAGRAAEAPASTAGRVEEPGPAAAPVEASAAPGLAGPVSTRGRRGLRGVVVWGLPIILVIGIAIGAVGWYARRTYYVGLQGDRVTLFKGVPGGLLGWDPTVDRHTELTAADLTEADRADLESGHRFASKAEADRFLERLQEAREAMAASTTTTTLPAAPTTGAPSVEPGPPPTETSR
ncbi:MAG TPA: Stp1/IreP family PP2C-type Ser/Thr phosphatase [Acidimicrobiia bacterium]|nr:Stp1/IreP family PP2C-type Ser/Thr phosphatase [Acidimicrobiia bacterium]